MPQWLLPAGAHVLNILTRAKLGGEIGHVTLTVVCLITSLSTRLTARPPGTLHPQRNSSSPSHDLILQRPEHPLPKNHLCLLLPPPTSTPPICSPSTLFAPPRPHCLCPSLPFPSPRLCSKVRRVTVSSSVIRCHSSAALAQAGGEKRRGEGRGGRHTDEGRMPN